MDPNQQPAQPTQTPPADPVAPTVAPVATMPAPAPEQPQPATAAISGAENPGKTLGIISLVTALIGMGLIGLIVGIVGLKKSKKAGMGNGLAVGGIVVSIFSMIIGLAIFAVIVLSATSVVQKCQELGPGTHYEGGVTYTCS